MAEEIPRHNEFTTRIQPHPATLGVEKELRRFATNEYLDSRNKQILVGTNDSVVDEQIPPKICS